MVTDCIMSSVRTMFDKLFEGKEREKAECVLEMLGDLDEDQVETMSDEEYQAWLSSYISK